MRILLTGATGLIGSAVYARLREQHEVVRLGRRPLHSDVIIDLLDSAATQYQQLPAADALVHCAGVIDEQFRVNGAAGYQIATYGAEALANAAMRVGVRRIVYVSSTHVYGLQQGVIDEKSPVNPLTHYALAHYCTEQILCSAAAAHGAATTILRPNAVYGALDYPDFFQRWGLIPFSFPRDALADGAITLKSTGLQRRNFVSTANIAALISTSLDAPLSPGVRRVNAVGGVTESVLEFAHRCAHVLHEVNGATCRIMLAENVPSSSPDVAAPFELVSTDQGAEIDGAAELDAYLANYYRLTGRI